MPHRKQNPSPKPLGKSPEESKKRAFPFAETSFNGLMMARALLAIVLLGIGLTFLILFTNTEQVGEPSEIESAVPKLLTREEQFLEVSELPLKFNQKLPVEKMDILKSKISVAEELVSSGVSFSKQATDKLVSLYGKLCLLQELEGVDAQQSYKRLDELRQQALAEDNQKRVAAADFLRALSATSRLRRSTESTDFQFAADALLNLDSKHLVDVDRASALYLEAIGLHDKSSDQQSTAILLPILGEKLCGSPVSAISNLGLNLKDYARYAKYYAAFDKQPNLTREEKLQFFRGLFSEIEKDPPQSPKTYGIVLKSIDRLLNLSERGIAAIVVRQLEKSASNASPSFKTYIDEAITSIKTRVVALGKTVELSGSNFEGSPLQLPNDKPTILLFCSTDYLQSMDYLKKVAKSNRFDDWETNMLVACVSPQSVEELKKIADEIGKFTVLDSATAQRLRDTFAIDLLPYEVSLDKDGKAIRVGAPTN